MEGQKRQDNTYLPKTMRVDPMHSIALKGERLVSIKRVGAIEEENSSDAIFDDVLGLPISMGVMDLLVYNITLLNASEWMPCQRVATPKKRVRQSCF